jgi:hypothetical protein
VSKEGHPNIVPFYGLAQGFGSFPSAIIPYYPNSNALAHTLKNPSANKRKIVRIEIMSACYFVDCSSSLRMPLPVYRFCTLFRRI